MFRALYSPAALTRAPLRARTLATSAPKFPVKNHGILPTSRSAVVSHLHFFNSVTGEAGQIPTYRVLDSLGIPIDGAEAPEVRINEEFARKLYENMQLLPTMDNILNNVQRQGKISFYVRAQYGEEATIIGAAAALANDDECTGQYREMGVLLWRGFGIDAAMNQCFGNHGDTSGKGRQMPMHFGSVQHHFHTISSPLATQIPQAAGVGFALKRDPARRNKNVACVFFGEGAASEGDFHAGMLLASTIPSPTIFLARNNGFAISTPAHEQYHGDGIAARGAGYGIDTVRVDGNDILAVINAVTEARRRCLESGRAVLVEAMTYRIGHHSTSDDSFAYRGRQEVEDWKKIDNPITRFRLFMESRGWWDEKEEEELKAKLKNDVIAAFKRAESLKRSDLRDLFTDVYGGEEPWNLAKQREELAGLLKKYGDVWEPWHSELKRFRDEGKKLVD
ncbi:thiamine diphosphate-binding protein [Melanogaster broomeanus]|nr:thiamine diphosphate-binding protein [Melanogaster broomeanus]